MPGEYGYGKCVAIAVDQLFNALFNGWPDESLSSRAFRDDRDGRRHWPRKLIDGIFCWQKNHCKSAYENERKGRQLPPEMRPVDKEGSCQG